MPPSTGKIEVLFFQFFKTFRRVHKTNRSLSVMWWGRGYIWQGDVKRQFFKGSRWHTQITVFSYGYPRTCDSMADVLIQWPWTKVGYRYMYYISSISPDRSKVCCKYVVVQVTHCRVLEMTFMCVSQKHGSMALIQWQNEKSKCTTNVSDVSIEWQRRNLRMFYVLQKTVLVKFKAYKIWTFFWNIKWLCILSIFSNYKKT